MKRSIFLGIAAILALLFGLAFLLIPKATMSAYGITLDANGQWMARYLGSAFLGISVLTWYARTVASGVAIRAIITGGFVLTVTGFIVGLLNAISTEDGNGLIWSTVVIYLLLAIGYGYYQFVSPATD